MLPTTVLKFNIKCTHYGNTFINKADLTTHVENTHTNAKNCVFTANRKAGNIFSVLTNETQQPKIKKQKTTNQKTDKRAPRPAKPTKSEITILKWQTEI